jgi:alkylation response protein AidB-like acyl-CoA dehydrogenase/enoyl-CoA hydratase/carnithine racemase
LPASADAPEKITGDIGRNIRKSAQRLIDAIFELEKPVIAAVNGTAAGLGFHLAIACDLVVAAEDARFIEVFVRRGLVPDAGGAYLLPRLVGLQRAKELMFLGDDLSATQAHEMGLVNRVVPREDVIREAGALAARLANGPTRALALTKWLANRSLDSDRQTMFENEAYAQDLNMTTEDGNEGVRAFVERRPSLPRLVRAWISPSPELETFRAEVRSLPGPAPRRWTDGVRPTATPRSRSPTPGTRLHETGWATPTWPERYGGQGLDVLHAAVYAEIRASMADPTPAGGEILVGPTILHLGPTQRRRFLPPIARARGGAGLNPGRPDLASLQTTGRIEGDELVIDGHKIWTSQAPDADLMFLLVRTDPTAPAHRGISYVLLDMDQRGVEVRAIAQPDGTAGFAEVLLTGARCPLGNVVGELHGGWRVAMSTLGFERGTSATSSWYRYDRDLREIAAVAKRRGIDADPVVRQRIARAWSRIQIMRFQGFQVLTSAVHPGTAPATRAIEAVTKLAWTEFHRELTELAIDVAGPAAMVLQGDGRPAPGVGLGHRPAMHPYPVDAVQSAFLFARAGTIYGGTSEVQRNIVAERTLGLPR